MFPSLPFSLSSSLWLPPPLDMSLRSPRSLLRRNHDTKPDLYPDLDLVVDAPKAALPLDLFLPLLWVGINLGPDLVLAS